MGTGFRSRGAPYDTDGDEVFAVRTEYLSHTLQRVRAMLVEGFEPGRKLSEGRPPEPPALKRLAEIGSPALVVIGDMPDILEIGNLFEADIPKAKKVLFPGAAHMVNMERPADFNRIVLDFLRRDD